MLGLLAMKRKLKNILKVLNMYTVLFNNRFLKLKFLRKKTILVLDVANLYVLSVYF